VEQAQSSQHSTFQQCPTHVIRHPQADGTAVPVELGTKACTAKFNALLLLLQAYSVGGCASPDKQAACAAAP
jgi:hypothetical protein